MLIIDFLLKVIKPFGILKCLELIIMIISITCIILHNPLRTKVTLGAVNILLLLLGPHICYYYKYYYYYIYFTLRYT